MDMLVFISKNANRREMIEEAVMKIFGNHTGAKIMREARVDRMFSEEQDIMRSLEDVGVDDESSNISSDSLLSSAAVEKMIVEDMQLEDTFDDEPAPHTNEDEALRLSPIAPQLPTTSEQAAPFVPRRPAWMLAQGVASAPHQEHEQQLLTGLPVGGQVPTGEPHAGHSLLY